MTQWTMLYILYMYLYLYNLCTARTFIDVVSKISEAKIRERIVVEAESGKHLKEG